MKPAYYNEIDPYAAQWLRNLIKAGHIPAGDVDERSIVDVSADDVRGYGQQHYFAGVGVWAYALRLAGFPEDRDVWTGSCPCQPFSVAGRRNGFDDERHLWPAWFRLIEQRRPQCVFGEQVASSAALPWIDAVFDDLESAGYRTGAVDFPACGVGAPHIRNRLFWVADAGGAGRQQVGRGASGDEAAHGRAGRDERQPDGDHQPSGHGAVVGLADAYNERRDGLDPLLQPGRSDEADPQVAGGGETVRLADADEPRSQGREPEAVCGTGRREEGRATGEPGGPPSPVNGFWQAADWLWCRDGKHRPAQPGIRPLADRPAGRVGALRAYGNAIVAPQAAEFVSAYLKCRP